MLDNSNKFALRPLWTICFALITLAMCVGFVRHAPAQAPASRQPSAQARPASFDLNTYGVRLDADARLLAVMGALDAAGFEAAPQGVAPPFLQELRGVNANLDENLRDRLRAFYMRNRLPAPASPAQQAARYITLAFALGAAPALDAPVSTDDLPEGVIDVLDFAPLVREYYQKSNLAERLPAYTRAAQTIGNGLRPGIADMLRTILSRFRVQPVVTITERIPVAAPAATDKTDKKEQRQTFTVRERERRFQIVPDPLAVPGTINLRVVGDDYFVVLPVNANPASPELRRAYIQFLVEPLVRRFSRDIALRRADINLLLTPEGATTATPAQPTRIAPRTSSVFEAISRSLVAAADARIAESLRTENLRRSGTPKNDTDKAKFAEARREIADARAAALADAYERGGVLAFYFAEQLDGIESSGFDATNLIPDMIASFDVRRERRRLAENSEARARYQVVERRRADARAAEFIAAERSAGEIEIENPNAAALARSLTDVDGLLRARDYTQAETRLRALLADHNGDARIFFALGQAASLGAEDATDEAVQIERLNRALANYRLSAQAASPDTDKALLSRAHTAIGRIHAFLDQPKEAAAAFDLAIKIGEVPGGAYSEAERLRAGLLRQQP